MSKKPRLVRVKDPSVKTLCEYCAGQTFSFIISDN